MTIKRLFLFFILFSSPLISLSQNWDVNLLKDINIDRNQKLDPAFKTISSTTLPLTIAIPTAAITYALINKEESSRKKALLISTSLVSAGIITTTLKYTFDRERPYDKYPEIQNLTLEGSPSFPSAHTSLSFSLATSVSLAYPKWYVIAPSYLWAGSVAYSRMHLGIHYPSDVLTGAIIGAGSAYLSYRLNNWMDEKWKKSRTPGRK